jgi:hypothetical protein
LKKVLKTDQDIQLEHYLYQNRRYDVHIFSVEKHEIIGAMVTDVTLTVTSQEKMAKKAREVIVKNMQIVQNIACLLGEHMVETETILSAIADSYENDSAEDIYLEPSDGED